MNLIYVINNPKHEKGFTLFESIFSLVLITILFLIIFTVYVTLIDKAHYVEHDQELVNAELDLENWLLKDYREHTVLEIEMRKPQSTNVQPQDYTLVFKVKDNTELGYSKIMYTNKKNGFYRVSDTSTQLISARLIPYRITDMTLNNDIVTFKYYYPKGQYTKTLKVHLHK